MDNEKIKRIAVLNDPAEAEVLRGLLEAQGIRVMLSKEGASTAYGLTAGAFGEVEVFVSEAQAEEAERLFEENFGPLDSEAEED
ncbi:MAG: DUF2007 domain-containing protein [Anaerolineales bacterium]|jgi:hypothetical protein